MKRSPKILNLAEALSSARETRELQMGSGVLRNVLPVFQKHFDGQQAIIVSDSKSFAVAGEQLVNAWTNTQSPMAPPFIFTAADLYAEHGFVSQLESALRGQRAIPIAVGSGTINDLTKLASHRTSRPYMCVATAASMDGYTAFGASITYQGSKQTFDCPAPTAVVADLDVICAAPPEMNAWGYADLLAKVTSGADWIVADALGVEPIDARAWDIVQGKLRDAVADPAGVRIGDRNAVGRLIEGLMLGGFAMQATKSSRPASGAEHQFSHLWDMQHHTHHGSAPSHGLKVGIGTIAVTALYETLLNMPLEQLDVARCCAAWPSEEAWLKRTGEIFQDAELLAVAKREISAKYVDAVELGDQLTRLRRIWPELRDDLREQLIPLPTLKAMLHAAGAATEPEQIGISRARLRDSYVQAYFLRRRFTVLDIAVRTGALGSCLDSIFDSTSKPPAPSPLHNPATIPLI